MQAPHVRYIDPLVRVNASTHKRTALRSNGGHNRLLWSSSSRDLRMVCVSRSFIPFSCSSLCYPLCFSILQALSILSFPCSLSAVAKDSSTFFIYADGPIRPWLRRCVLAISDTDLDTFPYIHPKFLSVSESCKNQIELDNPEVTMALNGQSKPGHACEEVQDGRAAC